MNTATAHSVYSADYQDLPIGNYEHLLNEAIRHNAIKIVNLLLERGANASGAGFATPPLFYAIEQGRAEIVKSLLTHGADVTATDTSGRTPMHDAAMFGFTKIVELLLEHGADITTKDWYLNVPLSLAKANRATETVKLLEAHEATL